MKQFKKLPNNLKLFCSVGGNLGVKWNSNRQDLDPTPTSSARKLAVWQKIQVTITKLTPKDTIVSGLSIPNAKTKVICVCWLLVTWCILAGMQLDGYMFLHLHTSIRNQRDVIWEKSLICKNKKKTGLRDPLLLDERLAVAYLLHMGCGVTPQIVIALCVKQYVGKGQPRLAGSILPYSITIPGGKSCGKWRNQK